MKSLGLPPNDPRLAAMNWVQWDWAIMQVAMDKDDENRRRSNALLLQISATNPAMALKLKESMDEGDPGRLSEESSRIEAAKQHAAMADRAVEDEDEEVLLAISEWRSKKLAEEPAESAPMPIDGFVEDPDVGQP